MGTYLQTLCWDCQKALGECSWSDNFQPVKGWDAVPTEIKTSVGNIVPTINSYYVRSCPLFELDEKTKKKMRRR